MRWAARVGLLLFLGICGGARAEEDVTAELLVVPSALTGNLNPFYVAVNGKRIVVTRKKVSRLQINGNPIKPAKGKSQPFFATAQTDSIEVAATNEKKEEEGWEIDLPSLKLDSVQEGVIYFSVTGEIQDIIIDGKRVSPKEGKVSWRPTRLGAKPTRFNIEVLGKPGKAGRLYNLKVVKTATPEREVAEEPREPARIEPDNKLTAARLSAVTVYQSGGWVSTHPQLAWTPQLDVGSSILLEFEIGFSPIRASVKRKIFLAIESQLFLGTDLGDCLVQVGGGLQTWVGHGGTKPMASLQFQFPLGEKVFDLAGSIHAGYSAVFSRPNISHLGKLGVLITL